MTISQRLWDDDVVGVRDESTDDGPHFVAVLVNMLQISDRELAVQTKAISDWLDHHTASPMLIRSIRSSRFRDALSHS